MAVIAAVSLGVAVGLGQGMSVFGQNIGGGGMMSPMDMMGGPLPPSARPLSMAQAEQILHQWPSAHHHDGLVLDEVEAYTQNFYGQFKESATGKGAIQVLVDRYTGRAMPEMGPNMMWNTKYGNAMMQDMMSDMMGGLMNGAGMMGGSAQSPNLGAAPHLAETQARQRANQFLGGYLPGAVTGDGDTFYGYYHFDVARGGRQVGMLSVNDTTGQVWYHTWHGEFLDKREIAYP